MLDPPDAMSVAMPTLAQRIERYVALAQRRPAAYRVRLTVLAILGDAALTLVQLAPLAVPVWVGVLFYPHPWLLWLAVAATLFFVWLFRPQLRVRGRVVAPEEAPILFESIDHLRANLDVPGRMEVVLDESLNASAGEGRGLFGLLGTRRVLTLGMPLLVCMSKDELLAVIAHELGHFSNRHGRLGNWLYRAHMGWAQYAATVPAEQSAFERAVAWYGERFAPYFQTLSLVHSRQCEYEADRDAASIAGAENLGRALSRIAVLADYWQADLGRALARWRQTLSHAPEDYYRRLAQEIETEFGERGARRLERAMAERSGWHDTHPCLADRLAAIGEAPRTGPIVDCAGAALFDASWPRIRAEFDARWQRDAAGAWAIEHERYRRILGPLLAADDDRIAAWPMERKLARARALRAVDAQAGKAALAALHATHPEFREASFAYAAALLNEDDADGVALMTAIADQDVSYAEPAYARLLAYAERTSDETAARRWQARWQRSARSLAQAMEAGILAIERKSGQSGTLASEYDAYMRAVLHSDQCVVSGWLFKSDLPLEESEKRSGRIQLPVLVLLLDGGVLSAQGAHEDDVQLRFADALAAIVPSNERVFVRTYLTTEPLPGYLQGERPWFERSAVSRDSSGRSPD